MGQAITKAALVACSTLLVTCIVPRVAASGVSSANEDKDATPQWCWRVPERDAPNCLYLLLRVYGKEVSYHDVAQCFPTGRGATLLGLKQAAEKFGLSVRMVRPTMGKDLYDRLPAIAVMDIAGTGESTFVLLHYFNKENADFISGGPVRYERVSTDDFRRSWSGVALVVDESRAGQMEMLRWTVGGLVVFLVSRLVWSVSRRAQSRRASYRVL